MHSAWGFWGEWFRRKEVDSAAAVGLCWMHKAPVRCLLGFLFNNNNTNICNAHSVSKHTESEAQLSQSNAEVLVT